MELRYIDTHCHIHFDEYVSDIGDVLNRCREAGVWAITVGTDTETSKRAIIMAHEHREIYACIGVHPNDTEEIFDPEVFERLVSQEKVVAIGECGLDYYRLEGEAREEKLRQKHNFELQIQCAIKYNLPLMLHIRSHEGTTDAHDDALAILKTYKERVGDALRMHCHFFTMNSVVADGFLALGATFGIPGVVTYTSAKALQEAVRHIPLAHLMSETDAPYAAPVPHRGKRNEPIFVIDTVRAIANVRGESEEHVREVLLQNALKTFNIQP